MPIVRRIRINETVNKGGEKVLLVIHEPSLRIQLTAGIGITRRSGAAHQVAERIITQADCQVAARVSKAAGRVEMIGEEIPSRSTGSLSQLVVAGQFR